jgi:hypothetical protein
MSKRGLLCFAVALLASPSFAGTSSAETPEPVSRACGLVTAEEAATLLGPRAEQMEGDTNDTCHYLVEGQSLQLVIRAEEMGQGSAKFLEIVRKPAMAEKGYTVQDEPSLGKGSFSGRKPDSMDFQMALAKGVLGVGLRDKDGTIPPEMLDKLRAVARKAAGRF